MPAHLIPSDPAACLAAQPLTVHPSVCLQDYRERQGAGGSGGGRGAEVDPHRWWEVATADWLVGVWQCRLPAPFPSGDSSPPLGWPGGCCIQARASSRELEQMW